MPLAAYSYPYPPYSSAGSGVNNLHPAPPALADGHRHPPGAYPCGYPPHYGTPAPPYCCPYAEHCLHHSGALLQSMHPQYPHLHYCPGLPCCSLPPDGLPTYSIAAPDNVDGLGAHGKPPHGPDFAFDSFPNHRSPQLFYPPMSAMPLWRPDERLSCDEDADPEVKAGVQGYLPSHSLVPFHDKVQGEKPNITYGGTPQWRGFPVMWNGNAPFALIPLSNIDGEQNLFVPKKVSTKSAPEEPQKNASAYDCPLPVRNHLPILWKQQGLIPAETHEDGKVKLNAKDSLNDDDGKVKLNAKDPLNDEVSNSKPLPVVWDGKLPLVLLPAMHEAGKEFSSLMPFKLMPMTKEMGQESSKLQSQAIIPADMERQQDSDKPVTKNALVTAFNGDEKESRGLQKGKAFMPKNEGPIKVIPVVQLPAIDSSLQKEVSVHKEPSNDVGQGQAGMDHTHAKPQTGQQAGKMASHAQHVPKQDTKGPSKNPPVEKKSFPAIKLVPPSDAKRCKSPRKNVTAAQKKPAVSGTQGVEPVQDGCHAGVAIPTKDASLHEKDPGSNGSDVKAVHSVNADGKAADEAASLKTVDCKLVSSLNVDCKRTEEAVSSNAVEQKSNDTKVLPVASMEAADSSCDGKRFQAPWVSESEKPQMKMMSPQDSAAKCIQAVYRGYCVRRSQPLSQLRIIKEVQANMLNILEQLDSKAEALKELMERRKLSESVMALLLKLDTVQGRLPYVREQRKYVAKELSRVLETLDNIEQEKLSLSTSEAVNEIGKDQEETSLSTPKAVNDLAEGQEEMSSQSQKNISTPKAVTAGEIDCSAKETMVKEMTVDEVANLTMAASNACTLGIREHCEGVAVAETEVSSFSDDTIREEKVEAGSESGASKLPPAVLQVESMNEDFGVDQEKPVAFDPCGNLKEHMDPYESVTEQRRQCDPENRGGEESKEDPGLDDADADTSTALIPDAGRDQKIGNQDDTGAVVRSLPSEVQVREKRNEIAKMERDDFDDVMHLADMKQADQLDEIVKEEPGDADKVLEELKEDAVVSRSPTKIIKEELMEHIEPRLGGREFEGSVQQLDVAIAAEFNEEKDVSRLLPDELRTNPLNSAEVLLDIKCLEQLPLPVDECGVGSLGSNKSTSSQMGVKDEGVTATAQQILEEESNWKQEGENVPDLQNLRDISHEKYGVNVPHSNEGDVALTRLENLVDGQQAEGRESNLSSDAAEVERVDNTTRTSMDDILLHGDAKVEKPLLSNGLVVGNIDDGKAKTLKDVFVESTESMLLDNTMALDSHNNEDTDAANILAARCPIKEVDDEGLEDGSMLDAPLNRYACDDDKKACCVQELVDVKPTKTDEEVDSNDMMMEKSRVPVEDISVESCMQDAGIERNLCSEESEPKVLFNTMDKREDQILAKYEAGDMQKHCFEKLAVESKNLLAVVEKLTEWNQQQANLITQLSQRMSRLEEARNAPKHPVHSRKGRSRRRKISVNI